jgi:outer membrane protein OmpA-like peptidoglycan-associated protein
MHGEARELSPMERAVLRSLQSAGEASLIDLACRLTPAMRPSPRLLAKDAELSVAHALTCLRVVHQLRSKGHLAWKENGPISITRSGRTLMTATHGRCAVASQMVMSAGATAGLSVALSACSLAALHHRDDVQPVTVQPVYSLQQVRTPDGSLRFAACAEACAPVTPKALAVERSSRQVDLPPPTPTDQSADEPRSSQQLKPAQQAEPTSPVSVHRVYFRFGSAQLETEAIESIRRALPELKQRSRIDVYAGADPIGTNRQNERIKELRRRSVERILIDSGIDSRVIRLNQSDFVDLGVQVQGMRARSTKHAEMRRVELVGQ